MDTLQVIAQPTRRAILELVWRDEMSAGAIADRFDASFAAVSQHLGKLRAAQLVTVRRDGTHRMYKANHERLAPFRAMLEAMWSEKLDQLVATIEEDG